MVSLYNTSSRLHSATRLQYALSERQVCLNSRSILSNSRISPLEDVIDRRRYIVDWLSVNYLTRARGKRKATRTILTRRKGLLQHCRVWLRNEMCLSRRSGSGMDWRVTAGSVDAGRESGSRDA